MPITAPKMKLCPWRDVAPPRAGPLGSESVTAVH